MTKHVFFPTISVIMAAYNAEKYICESIQSILNQTYEDFELIIINDGSTDRTFSLISSFYDNRIILLTNETNRGLTYSLNKGISHARTDILIRMDADDISYPERFDRLLSEFTNNPNFGIICSRAWIIYDETEKTGLSVYLKSPEQIYVHLQFTNCIIHSSVLIKRETLRKIGLYNEKFRYAQDYELWNRLSKQILIKQIDKPLLAWRAPSKSVVRKKECQWAEAEQQIFIRSCEHFFGTWNRIIPQQAITIIKIIIGPKTQNDEEINRIFLLVCPFIFWILTRKIISMAPKDLNKNIVSQHVQHWNSNFFLKWKMLFLFNIREIF